MKMIIVQTQLGQKELDFFDHLHNIQRLHASLRQAAMTFYGQEAQYVEVPFIVGITGACENIDTLFRIKNRRGVPAFFNQTGQLVLECYQIFSPRVFTIIRSGRDEGQEDARHLLEFSLTEEEFSWPSVETAARFDEEAMFEHLLNRIESLVKHLASEILQREGEQLQHYGCNVIGMQRLVNYQKFLRISYSDAVELLNQTGYPELAWGDDLKAEHEAWIIKLLNEQARGNSPHLARLDSPVFIVRYPQEIKFFNMMQSTLDERVVLSADLILPIAGEAVGSAVREPDAVKLKDRLLTSKMFAIHQANGGTLEEFKWYLDLVGSGRVAPHAGYGLGNERLIQWLTGFTDIRDCAPFSLFNRLTGDLKPIHKAESVVLA